MFLCFQALPTPAPTKQGSRCDELRQTALDEETTGMVGEEVANCEKREQSLIE